MRDQSSGQFAPWGRENLSVGTSAPPQVPGADPAGTPAESAVVRDPELRASWTTLDAVLVIVGAFVIYLVGSIVVLTMAHAVDRHHTGVWVDPASYAFLSLGTLAMVYWLIIARRRSSWRNLGFRLTSWTRVAQAVVGGEVAVIVGIAIIASILDRLTSFHVKGNAKELLPAGQSHLSPGQYLVLLFLVSVMAPLTEETLFRGVLYQAMRSDIGRITRPALGIAVAAVISGGLFGLVHAIGGSSVVHALPILAYFGIVLALAFQQGRSIYASILLHALNNAIAVTSLLVS